MRSATTQELQGTVLYEIVIVNQEQLGRGFDNL